MNSQTFLPVLANNIHALCVLQIYKCSNPACPRPNCYRSAGSAREDSMPCERMGCTGRLQLVRYVVLIIIFFPQHLGRQSAGNGDEKLMNFSFNGFHEW